MKTLSKDGTEIAYTKTGKGPALILVDGAFCYRKNGGSAELASLLADNFTVYFYDRRGRGESMDTKPYAISKEVEDLNAIVQVTKEIPFMCGISSGGSLIVQALANEVKAKKIILYEPPYVAANSTDATPPEDAKKELDNFIQQKKQAKAVKYFMNKVIGVPAFFIFLFRVFNPTGWKKNESVAHTLVYDVEIMGSYSLPIETASKITCPVLVIGGEKSPERLISAVKQAGDKIPNAQTRFLKGQNHNISMKILAPELINFFNTK